MTGFTYRGGTAEGGATIQPFIAGAAVVPGDIVKLSSGKIIPNTTDAEGVIGVVVALPSGYTAVVDTDPGVMVCTDPDAIYATADANARMLGAPLDVAGATGAMTVAAASNNDFIVAAPSTASQETLVRINRAKHYTIGNDLT